MQFRNKAEFYKQKNTQNLLIIRNIFGHDEIWTMDLPVQVESRLMLKTTQLPKPPFVLVKFWQKDKPSYRSKIIQFYNNKNI